ncbi:MAG: prepilin peptidase [Oceanospirillaceae bacterium]|nr:prepilin peptidase [Oceanospirillaceae bacterium]MCP5351112.1 prepilin peptidase [Oceanospirillaceae bacterium]
MVVLDLLANNTLFFLFAVTLLGLCVGSFLNVVIYRLPIMLKREWQAEIAEMQGETLPEQPVFNLTKPHSACPKCNAPIRPWQNIPVISYLFLRGKCANCKNPISIRYPLVEIVTGALSLVVAQHFGYSWASAGLLVFTWALIALTMIDIDEQLLPDNITLPLLWLGLICNSFGIFTDLHSAVFGAIAGYLSLWSVFWLFKLLTGKEGMGYGDFKLLAALGAFFGWQSLPVIILLSSVVGAVVGIIGIMAMGRDKNIPIPFGPYLAAAGWIAALWGQQLTAAYFAYMGIH